MSAPKTLFDKIWDAHVVHQQDDGTCLIYIDRHLVHEVTSPQALRVFEIITEWCAHPIVRLPLPITIFQLRTAPLVSKTKKAAFRSKLWKKMRLTSGVPYFAMDDIRQGIVHVIGPEQGFTLPGMTIACGGFAHRNAWGVWRPCFWHWHF